MIIVLSIWATLGWAASVEVKNPSFENPAVDNNAFPALPLVNEWIEKDNDVEFSTNTGVFPNPAADTSGHLLNTDGNQLAFLGSQQGNGLEQNLTAQYLPGYAYRLTVAVGVSTRFPPLPDNSLELAFYMMDGNEPIDIATQRLTAADLSLLVLIDYSVLTPVVFPNHSCAGKEIGIAIRSIGPAGGFWDLDNVRVQELQAVNVDVQNASFELPLVDSLAFPALPFVDLWQEWDNDLEASANTGVFPNPSPESPGSLLHVDGEQLAFLGSEQGNAIEQDLLSQYRPGMKYQLTVGVGISGIYPPLPENALELAYYYMDGNEPVDIVSETVPASDYVSTELRDVTVTLPAVEPNDAWAGSAMGVAIRSVGPASGFWDVDNVRVTELLPSLHAIDNDSFEGPALDPNAFGVLPFVDSWTEYDQDVLGSTNTGVFLNTPMEADNHVINAHGLQLAYLGSEQGNALEQELAVSYEAGYGYRLTVAVGVSSQFAPFQDNRLELVMYYHDGNEPVTVASESVPVAGMSSTQLKDVSVYVPTVQPDQDWAGYPIGLALRSWGPAGGFWDLDSVRLGIHGQEILHME